MECKMLEEEQATGKTAELYDEIRSKFGMVPNFFKAQAAVDPDWALNNWVRVKQIMLKQGALDRKTKELIAMVVAVMTNCQYCHLAHKTMAMMAGATEEELNETAMVMELFTSFSSIASSLEVPCDVTPVMVRK
ncbi:carboxymuconolactone decarboxylase family protein [Desulfurivibrio sp. D14AmB]|uniref:carboxymuconolactone decarboxylase family protein n=1 Tax=Desulfurivibrio sp. D14AmB TaxID=3374370 RepID=UPI00376F1013